jgi:DNA-binding NarL/FixJ family response regulator
VRPRTIAVVHRHAIVAEGLATALGTIPWIVPTVATTVPAEVEAIADRLDAAAIDAGVVRSRDLAARLRRRGVRVVMLGTSSGEGEGEEEEVLVRPDAAVSELARALVPGADRRAPLPLSERQRAVLSLVARGFTAHQVARHLGISPKTVEQHKAKIYARLGVPNQAAAVNAALAVGLEGNMA